MRNILCAGTVAMTTAIVSPVLAQETDFRAETDNVLLQLGLKPSSEPTAAEFGESLSEIVARAQAEGQSDAYIEALVVEAANQGELQVPDAMRTVDGEIDRTAMIASIVSAATHDRDAEASVADPLVREALGKPPSEVITYTVQEGDSLGGIAGQFYGDPLRYEEIFEANRDTIDRADRIFVGQILVLPNVSSED